jgi:hypothetical protein
VNAEYRRLGGHFVSTWVAFATSLLSSRDIILSAVLLITAQTSFKTLLKLVCVLVNSMADKMRSRFDKSDSAQTHPCRHKVTPVDGRKEFGRTPSYLV